MSKLRKKIVVPISLTLTGCLVVAAFVLNDSLTKVDANVAFNGISDIVSSHGKDKPFNIVEVVPDKKMASIGYLIDGQEPDNWFGTLSKMSDKDGAGVKNRSAYMEGLKTKLAPITTEKKDNTKPLYYEPYEESYVSQGDDWTELALVDMDRINKGTTGYKMTEQAEGDYKFNTDYQLAVNEDGLPTGHYRQNVDHYVFMQGEDETEDGSESVDTGSTGSTTDGSDTENENGNKIKAPGKRGYYSVAFSAVKLPDGMTNTQYLVPADNSQKADGNTDSSTDNTTDTGAGDDAVEKHVVYAINSSYAIVNDESMQSIAKYDPKAYIYRTDNSDTTLPYEFVARADRIASLPDGSKPDYEKYTYYTVEMEYVPADKITDDETYYEVDTGVPIEFNYDETGEYGAVLDSQNPYEKIDDGAPDNQPAGNTGKVILTDTDGYFDIVEDSQTYTYVGDGNGNYIMVADKNGSLDYPVNTTHIYYKGGFKNNNWFRTGVFNQEGKTGDDDKTANMTFKVKTVTPKELEQIDVSTIDLLYLSGSKSILSKDLENNATKYNNDNDISWDKVKQIVERVHQSGIMMPVIVDNGIVWPTGSADYSSNIKKLAGLLSCNNFSSLNFTKDSADNFINWNDANAIKYYRVDSKNHTHGYVVGNEYVIPRNSAPDTDVPFVLRDDFASAFIANEDETQFVNDAKNENFDEIAEYINSENTSRKKENSTLGKDEYAYYDKKISKAIVLSYIISYADKRDIINPTDSLNILDIEPGTVKNASDALNYDKLKKWLGTRCPEKKKVTITRVTSAEFIGRIEDLNNYDMIYMGLVADNLNYKDGHTVYNDWKMDGLKYSNVGDIVVINPNDKEWYWGYEMLKNGHAGLLDTDYINNGTALNTNLTLRKDGNNADYLTAPNTYRGSGNDITKQKVSELEDYIKAGFPVVFSDGFFSSNYDRGINEEYIDNCSNVFTLLGYAKDKDNVLKVDSKGNLKKQSNETAELVTYLTTEKPEILLKEQEKVKDTDYVEISNNQITLEFSINNAGGADSKASFNAQLFLDSNSDGKFSTTNEGIAANKIKLYCDGTIVNPVMGDDGKYMYSLNAGNYNYKLVYDLPNGFVGVMPWQLRVSQATNSYRYDQKSGYVYVKNSKGSPTKVKILQINSHLKHNQHFKGNFDMQEQKKNNTKFHKLLSQVKDFDLDIETVYYDDVNKMDEVCKKLQTYDMLVIGFGDCYDIDNTNNHLDKIKAYIQSGKPVLFAHDTTSFCNNKNDNQYNNVWGYKFNSIIRDTVGLDRYGILSNEYLKKGNRLQSTDEDFDKAVQTAEKNNTDIAYEPKSGNTVIVRQNQGFTYADLNQYQWKDNGSDHGEYRLYSGLDNYDVEAKTNKAVKVNSGQITTYPFKIADEINIATTHKQYYQLDMNQDADGDGESDIVVWYTLSNHGIYEQSPKDVRNNYYIYTMGNVTYSGVGHSDFSNNEDELKLYINTMIAAYSAAVHEPSIYLKENADTDSNDISTLYATIDDAIEEDAANKADARLDGADSTQDVYFTVKDSNLVRNQIDDKTVVYMDFYIEDPQKNPKDETIGTGDDKIYLKKVDWDIYSLNNDGTENERINNSKENSQLNKDPRNFFENNKTYKVKVPLSVLPEGANSIKIYAIGYSKIYQSLASGGDKETTTAKAYKTFQIQRVGLADLD